jgi:hypothetical protein
MYGTKGRVMPEKREHFRRRVLELRHATARGIISLTAG